MGSRNAEVPRAALHDRRIRPMDVLVLLAIDDIGGRDGWTHMGTTTLAKTYRMSRQFVIDASKRLQNAGWIEVRRRIDPETGADLSKEYRVNWQNTLPDEGVYETDTGVYDLDALDDADIEGTPLPDNFPDGAMLAAAAADPRYGKLPLDLVAQDFRRKYATARRRSWDDAWNRWLRTAHKDFPDEQRPRAVGAGHAPRVRTNASRLAEAAAQHALRRAN